MKSLVVLAATLVAGCAAGGSTYTEVADQIPVVAETQARIFFFRTRDSGLYIARKAAISINDVKVGATAYGGFHYHDVPQGTHGLRADMWDAAGQCELTLDASAGDTYYFQVDPRIASFGAFAVADFATSMLTNGVLLGSAAGIAGSSAESYGKECGGAFRLYPVDPQTALTKLNDLRLSD